MNWDILAAVIFKHGIAGFKINFNESGYALTLPGTDFLRS